MRSTPSAAARHACTAFLLLTVGGLFVSPAHASTRYLTLINTGAVTVLSVGVAAAGSHAWTALDVGGALIGGRAGQATVAPPLHDCRVDLRLTYPDRAPLTLTGLDVCQGSVVHLPTPSPATRVLATPSAPDLWLAQQTLSGGEAGEHTALQLSDEGEPIAAIRQHEVAEHKVIQAALGRFQATQGRLGQANP